MSESGMGNSDIKPKSVVQPVDKSEICNTNKCTQSLTPLTHQTVDESVGSNKIQSNDKVSEQHHYPKSSLDQRRQEIGVKCNEKTAMNKAESLVEEVLKTTAASLSELQHSSASCPHCGSDNVLLNKCQRCSRHLEKQDFSNNCSPHSTLEEKARCSSTFSNEKSSRRSRPQNIRQKFVEPQCVTLSSDDEEKEWYPECKKAKEDFDMKRDKCVDSDSSPSLSSDIISQTNMVANRLDTTATMHSPLVKSEHNLNTTAVNHSIKEEVDDELSHVTESFIKGPFITLHCRSVRIGSYKAVPTSPVRISVEGIELRVPTADGDQSTIVTIFSKQLLQFETCFNRNLSVIFLYVTPTVSRKFSFKLGLEKNSGLYWDSLSTLESQRRLTLLLNHCDETTKNSIKQSFTPLGVFKELTFNEANKILVSSVETVQSSSQTPAESALLLQSPKNSTSNKENGFLKETRNTRGSIKATLHTQHAVEMFSWSDGPDKFSVTTADYFCLDQDSLLNDIIIDFYIRFIFSTKLTACLKEKCHVFSSFFYRSLTTKSTSGRQNPIEDDIKLTAIEKRHARVKSWTKKVDIFEKDFLIIPINEHSHWFLAIICFPGLAGPVSTIDNQHVNIPHQPTIPSFKSRKSLNKACSSGEPFMIGNTTVTPVGDNKSKIIHISSNEDSERDEAESDDEELVTVKPESSIPEEFTGPIKQPCILFFDSLPSSAHLRVAATLRDYLYIEYRVKKGESQSTVETSKNVDSDVRKLFSKDIMVSACPKVPLQNNSYDCGVFVLQYAESFMKKPLGDFHLSRINLSLWFNPCMASRKRKDIQHILIRLANERNVNCDKIFKLLPYNDVRLALGNHQFRNSLPAAIAKESEINNSLHCKIGDIGECTSAALLQPSDAASTDSMKNSTE